MMIYVLMMNMINVEMKDHMSIGTWSDHLGFTRTTTMLHGADLGYIT